MRDTDYAKLVAQAEFDWKDGNVARIEHIFVKDKNQDEIRFSWWKDGRMIPKPLDLPEDDLVKLFQSAIQQGVFSEKFLSELKEML